MLIELFIKGGPIMWPILITSIIAVTVVFERVFFITREKLQRQPQVVEEVLEAVERQDPEGAIRAGSGSQDFVVRTIVYALANRKKSLSNALLRAAGRELRRYSRGLTVLDTIITLAPLLGLLGTVTGMIHSFGLLGDQELGAPTAITGGIAEALIATASGLGVAIVALIPFNYLNTRLEDARHEIQDAATHVELHLAGPPAPAGDQQPDSARRSTQNVTSNAAKPAPSRPLEAS